MSMKVRVKFTPDSVYGDSQTTLEGITEIHYLFRSGLGDKRIAFESDIQGTGWVYDVAYIAEFEATTETEQHAREDQNMEKSTLEKAQEAARHAEVIGPRPNDPGEEMQFAMMYAAIAQAEQLKRIADSMDLAMSTGENYDGTPARWLRIDDGRA